MALTFIGIVVLVFIIPLWRKYLARSLVFDGILLALVIMVALRGAGEVLNRSPLIELSGTVAAILGTSLFVGGLYVTITRGDRKDRLQMVGVVVLLDAVPALNVIVLTIR